MESSDAASGEQLTPGARLRQAREAAGISPREMADRLNWLPAHVTAIEENRFESLRGAAFVRGYLRAYARAVGLDEDELVALYAATAPEEDREAAADAPSGSSVVQAQKTGWSVALGTAIAVAIIAGIWWQQQSPEPARPVASSAQPRQAAQQREDVSPAVAGAAVESAAGESTGEDSAAVEAAAVEAAAVEAATEDAVEEAVAVEPVAVESAAEEPVAGDAAAPVLPPEPSATGPVAPAGDAPLATAQPVVAPGIAGDYTRASGEDALLDFSFSGDCWLEVRDGDGQLIYADLHRAGDRLALDGSPPFEVLAGNAAAVTLSFRGEPVTVRTRPGRDTARFTVGEP